MNSSDWQNSKRSSGRVQEIVLTEFSSTTSSFTFPSDIAPATSDSTTLTTLHCGWTHSISPCGTCTVRYDCVLESAAWPAHMCTLPLFIPDRLPRRHCHPARGFASAAPRGASQFLLAAC